MAAAFRMARQPAVDSGVRSRVRRVADRAPTERQIEVVRKTAAHTQGGARHGLSSLSKEQRGRWLAKE